jgi:hypothetical protein
MVDPRRTTVNLSSLADRIEKLRSDNAWGALPLSKKVVLLLEEYLELIEQKANSSTANNSDKSRLKPRGEDD